MPINSSFDKDYLFQQTFLGASIVNFNANMGFNSNSTSININLIEDKQNKRVPNAVDEGYHIWDKDKGLLLSPEAVDNMRKELEAKGLWPPSTERQAWLDSIEPDKPYNWKKILGSSPER